MKELGPGRFLSLLFPVGKIVVFASLNHLRTLCSRLLAHPVLLPKHPPKANHIVLISVSNTIRIDFCSDSVLAQ